MSYFDEESLSFFMDELEDVLLSKENSVPGKGLSTNDFTDELKEKLDGIQEGAKNIVVDSTLDITSENPVQNKAITTKIEEMELGISESESAQKTYTDTKIAELVGGAPEMLDTLKEIADAIQENETVIETLDVMVGGKVDKVEGMGLSSNDFTDELKAKLDGVEAGAKNITVDIALSGTSENPVQNKVISAALDEKAGISPATSTENGLMSASDKSKLDGFKSITNEEIDAIAGNQSVEKSGGYLDDTGLEHLWQKIEEKAEESVGGVSSFNGREGAVTPQSGDYTAAQVGAVPTGRKVNGKALSNDISLTAEDVGAVPTSRNINGKPLSADITLTASDLGAFPSTGGTVSGNVTITGNLLLKGGSNYGNKINFGDGDYVHIYENTDDRLEIKASYINFVTGTGAGRFTWNGAEIAGSSPIDGFHAKQTTFNADGTILETDVSGNTLKTTFNTNGTITLLYTFKSGGTRTRTITFTSNGVTET